MKLLALSEDNPIKQLLAFLLILLFSAIIFTGLAFVSAYFIYGKDTLNSLNDFGNAEVISALKYIQGWNHFGIFLAPALIFGLLSGKGLMNFYNAKKLPSIKFFVFAVVLLIMANPIIGLLMEWNSAMQLPDWLSGMEDWMRNLENTAKVATEALIKAENVSQLMTNILIMAVLPALGEEFLFRGFLMRYFSLFIKNIHINILIVSILFSAMHMQFYGFLPRMALGMMLGYFFYWSGSIWVPVIVHFINNGSMVFIYYLAENGKMNGNPEEFGTTSSVYFLVVNAILLVAGFYWFSRNRNRKPLFEEESQEEILA